MSVALGQNDDNEQIQVECAKCVVASLSEQTVMVTVLNVTKLGAVAAHTTSGMTAAIYT